MTRRRNIAASVGGWSARHRKTAIFGWLLFVVVAFIGGGRIGKAEMKDYEYLDGDSAAAEKVLDQAGFTEPAGEIVLVQSKGGIRATDPAFRAAVRDVVTAVERTGAVTNIRTPFDSRDRAPISSDQRSALVMFDMKGDPDTSGERVQPVLDAVDQVQRAHSDLRVAEAGSASADKKIGETIDRDFKRAGIMSVALTLGILLVAFGALLAALIPVGLALTAFLAATGIVAVTSHLLHIDESTGEVMLLIGMAVGVDYSLFYVRREREERAKGRSPEAALDVAAATSGRAVLISGITVMVAMAGMFLTGNGQFMGFAEGTILAVLTAIIGSLTILPALLSLLGDRIDKGRVPFLHRLQRPAGGGRFWGAVLGGVLRHPVLAVIISGGALVALAIPAFGMHTATPGVDGLQGNVPLIDTYKRIDAAFPGGNEPAQIIVSARNVTAPAVTDAISKFRDRALATGEANEPFDVRVNPAKTVAVVSIGVKGKGNDTVSEHAVHTLRDTVVPATLGQVRGVQAHVTGEAAASLDFNDQVRRSAPLVFVFVLFLAFLLLLGSFRSLVVAVKAILLNLLSVGAAYGVLVLVFQKGWGEKVLNFHSTGTIANWLPLFLFVVLFGLSMDYHVFILSRIREAYDRGMPTEDAVAHGIRSTAGVVTSAAVVMVAVFGIFATLSLESIKQLGVGLAAAVLIDATIVRAVLLPATMKLLGDWNWYLPRWLDWLPHLQHGGEIEPVSVPAAEDPDDRRIAALT